MSTMSSLKRTRNTDPQLQDDADSGPSTLQIDFANLKITVLTLQTQLLTAEKDAALARMHCLQHVAALNNLRESLADIQDDHSTLQEEMVHRDDEFVAMRSSADGLRLDLERAHSRIAGFEAEKV